MGEDGAQAQRPLDLPGEHTVDVAVDVLHNCPLQHVRQSCRKHVHEDELGEISCRLLAVAHVHQRVLALLAPADEGDAQVAERDLAEHRHQQQVRAEFPQLFSAHKARDHVKRLFQLIDRQQKPQDSHDQGRQEPETGSETDSSRCSLRSCLPPSLRRPETRKAPHAARRRAAAQHGPGDFDEQAHGEHRGRRRARGASGRGGDREGPGNASAHQDVRRQQGAHDDAELIWPHAEVHEGGACHHRGATQA
mmetsp:Transcript_23365/g.79155  ORF Transcript_23365/g.79155 Transcript_23365/m.79155 type:complete len:250 (-) Transcript_23365:289-1038(-)